MLNPDRRRNARQRKQPWLTIVVWQARLLVVTTTSERDIADRLASVAALRIEADRIEVAAVKAALRSGWFWSQVAEALGVTRQAAHKKHWRRLAEAGVDLRRRHG